MDSLLQKVAGDKPDKRLLNFLSHRLCKDFENKLLADIFPIVIDDPYGLFDV